MITLGCSRRQALTQAVRVLSQQIDSRGGALARSVAPSGCQTGIHVEHTRRKRLRARDAYWTDNACRCYVAVSMDAYSAADVAGRKLVAQRLAVVIAVAGAVESLSFLVGRRDVLAVVPTLVDGLLVGLLAAQAICPGARSGTLRRASLERRRLNHLRPPRSCGRGVWLRPWPRRQSSAPDWWPLATGHL